MRVSIIIPVFNAKDTIQEAVESALNQDFPKKDFEVIVINDGSTDNTLNVLELYRKRIRIINQENQGTVKAANKGFRVAQGRYVIKLDADDCFKSNILKEMAIVLDKKPGIDFVYCDYYEKSFSGKTKKVSTKSNIFNTVAIGIMFRNNKLAEQGFYREDIKFPEYDLLLRIRKEWNGFHIQKPLFYYNRREDSLTGNKRWVKAALAELEELHPHERNQIQKIRNY